MTAGLRLVTHRFQFIFLALKLSFESDEEQLSWLKQFERCGVKTGETEEVNVTTFVKERRIVNFVICCFAGVGFFPSVCS